MEINAILDLTEHELHQLDVALVDRARVLIDWHNPLDPYAGPPRPDLDLVLALRIKVHKGLDEIEAVRNAEPSPVAFNDDELPFLS